MRVNLDKSWKFYPGDLEPKDQTSGWGGTKAKAYNFGATALDFGDDAWRTVDIPHDFVMEGNYTQKKAEKSDMGDIPEMESIDSRHFAGGSLEGGVVWYRKTFDFSEKDKRVYLHFDGVYRNATVYFNEYYIGTHVSGYSSFYFDVTDYIRTGEKNVLAVRVDSRGREGWWYEGGGIYRHVYLDVKNDVHIEPWSVFSANTVDLENKKAALALEVCVKNRSMDGKKVSVKWVVSDDNNIVLECESSDIIEEWSEKKLTASAELINPKLWSTKNPYLYTLKTQVYTDDMLSDEEVTQIGFRHIHFDADKGIFLNGENIKIKGLCVHQDHAGVGIGVEDSIWEYRVEKLMEMGMNGLRFAHHQPAKELLAVCDKKGILVMDETRRMSCAPEDLENLRTLIRCDRNHPCVFIWGIGNEEVYCQDRPETAKVTKTMKMEVKKLDPTRPITSAVVCWNGVERFEHARGYMHVTKYLDVMGFNYCKTAWDDYHEQMPLQPVIITEESASSSTRGVYETDEIKGEYSVFDPDNESKCKSGKKAVRKNIGEDSWKYFAERDYLGAMFLWTGMDYRGEPSPTPYPAISSQFGILDYCGFKKDNFYYYKSWWTDEPVLHIFPHWNMMDKLGEEISVYCYSNLDEVELFVNGKSYGKKSVEKNWYLEWENVLYEPGEVKAVGYRDGEYVMEKCVQTVGAAQGVVLSPYKEEIKIGETAIINIMAVDSEGREAVVADNELRFEVFGAGAFLGTGNGNPASHESDKIPLRRLFNGKCQLLVKAYDYEGEIKVSVKSKGLISNSCIIKVK